MQMQITVDQSTREGSWSSWGKKGTRKFQMEMGLGSYVELVDTSYLHIQTAAICIRLHDIIVPLKWTESACRAAVISLNLSLVSYELK